ncbi:hypothetical protein [Amycolatopsis sp. NPDC004079]|uniref:hypothetical protein n=1 Tax=Amycolatopsis sp. NPDC004079 TaxID=3154549 RepID=UPI0033ABD4CD
MNTPTVHDTDALVRGSAAPGRRHPDIETQIRELRPWLRSFASAENALADLHAAILRSAEHSMGAVQDRAELAQVVYALALNARPRPRKKPGGENAGLATSGDAAVSEDVVLNCVAHVLAAHGSLPACALRAQHVALAKSWLNQARLQQGQA